MRVTIAHTYDFRGDRAAIGDELTLPQAWDAARATSGPFGIPASRHEWRRLAAQPELERRPAGVIEVARKLGARSLCSYGVGAAALEFNVHLQAPDLAITCTDYAPRATERLGQLFPEAAVVLHDLAIDDPVAADLHLMYRIDMELDTQAWRRVFARFAEPVLVVPVLLLGFEQLIRELARRLLKPRSSRAGWMRSEDALQALWVDTHNHTSVTIADMPAFLLRRKTD